MKTLVAILLVSVYVVPTGLAAKSISSVFDAPLMSQKRSLPATSSTPKTSLSCSYYPHFMVKEIDEGEVGAAQLSVIAVDATIHQPACQRANFPAEKVVNPSDWTGYFKGVKGDYVFFDAEDGVNGALGFAVFTAVDAKKVHEDSALGDLRSLVLNGSTLTLRYKRSFSGSCSVPHDGAECWAKIAVATGLTSASRPDCAAGYLKAKNEMAKERCEADKKSGPACLTAVLKELDAQRWNEARSVIVYEAETVLQPGPASTKALGGEPSCHPSD